jgi:tRNA G18 (ribose-2'-O)-methylase SpoU
MTDNKAGSPVDSQTLYKQQQTKDKPCGPIIIAIDLQTPANVGAIYRLADATAADKVIFIQDENSSFKNNKIVKRTSRNTSSKIATEYWTHEKFHADYQQLPTLIALELTTTASNIFSTKLANPCSFVIGSERHGIPASILDKCQAAVKIPMFGENGSMNVSHALAICLYEWHRQHTLIGSKIESEIKPGS